MQRSGLSVILPAYNEEESIEHVALAADNFLDKQDRPSEIIIVNDGSEDATGQIADRLSAERGRIRVIHHPVNRGYGRAIDSGIREGRFDLVFFTDADGQFDLENLNEMLPIIETGVPDIIIGYRIQRKDPFIRKFLSWGYNTLVGFLFDLNVKDIDCAFKVFKKEVFSRIHIESGNFFFNTEILVKARYFDMSILEMGVHHFPRLAGTSTVRLKHIPLTLLELWRIRKSLKLLRGPLANE